MSVLIKKRSGRMILRSKKTIPKELLSFRIKKHEYTLPICGDVLRRLLKADPELMITEELHEIFAEVLRAQQICEEIKSQEDMPGRRELLPFQRVAMHWLAAIRRGILADAQGLGKTVMAIAAAQKLNPTRTIIVVPKTKIQDWVHHVEKWIPDAHVLSLTGTAVDRIDVLEDWKQNAGFIIMNFAILRMHEADLIKAVGATDLLIIDEAHKLRNRKTGSFKSAKRLSRKVGGVFLLTASPTVNAVGDIWSLLSILDPVRFGSFWGFIYRFCNVNDNGFGLEIQGLKSEEREALERVLSPYILRRSEQLDLAEIKYKRVEYEMHGTQLKLYNSMRDDNKCKYKGEEIVAWDRLAQITRLRQLALSPALIFRKYNGPSKLNLLIPAILERPGQVVIFANYARLINLAVKVLREAGISVVSVSGDLASNQRDEALTSFKSGHAQVIALTHGVGGEGLDLVEADRAIFLEYAWHPAGNEHAAKRIHRYGQQSENIEITFMHTVESIEDHIHAIIMDKRKVTIKELIKGLLRQR